MNGMKIILATLIALCASQVQAQSKFDSSRAVPHVVIIFDDSGSMDERLSTNRSVTKLETAKEALITVLRDVPDGAKVGLYLLNGQYDPNSQSTEQWWIPLGPLNKTKATARIRELKTNGGTPLGSAIKAGCDRLLEVKKEDFYGTYRLLIVTDGETTGYGEEDKVNRYIPDIMARGFITTDVIGVDMASSHTLSTKVNNYRDASDQKQLEAGIKAVFAESSPNDKNSAEDYELTAALPADMVPKVIAAMNESGDYPVGEKPPVALDDEGHVQFDENGNPLRQEEEGGGGGGFFLILLVGAGIVVGLIFFFKVIASDGRRRY